MIEKKDFADVATIPIVCSKLKVSMSTSQCQLSVTLSKRLDDLILSLFNGTVHHMVKLVYILQATSAQKQMKLQSLSP